MTALKIWQTTAAAFVVLAFWILVLSLPPTGESWPGLVQAVLGVVGVVAIGGGAFVVRKGFEKPAVSDEKAELVATGAILALIGVILVVIAFMTTQDLNLTDERRLAIGVGGTALAGFVYAVTRFDTLRAAASVPVVVLLIGVVVWPNVNDLIDESVRKEIITWMGVILTASGVSEAAKQIGESNAKAKAGTGTAPDEITATGDLG